MLNTSFFSLPPVRWGIAVFGCGLLFSLLLAHKIQHQNTAAMNSLADAEATKLADQIVDRIELYQFGLQSVVGHILTRGEAATNRDMFRELILSRDIDKEFPGARGLGFIRRVAEQNEAEYLTRARADGDADFHITHFSEHSGERYVIEYIEPVMPNQQSLGLDIASETARRNAANTAMRTGEAHLTAPITLVQAEGKTQQSFLMLMPIYRNWITPTTEEERVQQAFGWSFMPLIMEEVLAKLSVNREHFFITLLDISSDISPTQFHSNHMEEPATDIGLFHQQVIRSVHGRQWLLDFSMTPQFYQQQRLIKPHTVLLWGLAFSMLIAMLTAALHFYISNRQRMISQQARLAAIVQNSADAIIATQTDDTVLTWNRGAEIIFGFQEDAVIGKKLNSLVLPMTMAEEGPELLQRLSNGENIVNHETQRQRSDGSIIDVSLSYSPLRNEKGQVTGFSKTLRDISAQKAAQAKILELNYNLEQQVSQRTLELKQLNQMLSNLLASATDVSIIATNPHGIITVFNTGAEHMLGYSADEMVGKCTPALLHRADEINTRGEILSQQYGEPIEGFRVFVHNVEHGGSETKKWTYVHKDGSELRVSITVSAMRSPDGELEGYLGIAQNITQAENTKRELIAARDQLSVAASIAELGVWALDVITGELSWNDEMFSLYGQPLSLRTQGLEYQHWRERIHPDDIEETERDLQLTISGERPFRSVFRLLLPDNSERFIQAAADSEKDANGKTVRIIGVNRDITIQQNVENHLREAKQKADDASAAKSSFLANMSHEIRTPMNAVLGMLQLVQKTQLNNRQQDYIVKAESSAKSLLGLLNDILDFSKMESGKLSFDDHPFELEELMSNLGVLLAANHGDKEVEVLFQLDPNLPRMLIADSLRLQQVLTNLASNALKFTIEGHVIVSITCLEKTAAQARLRFAISDTGIGISDEQQARIFNGFEQAESSTTRRFGGTGLGLVISKRLVNMMGGELHLSSELGVGSRFWFDIELNIADSTPYETLQQESFADIRVLVVDDDPLVADILQQSLALLGFDAVKTNSGLSAIEQVKHAHQSGQPFNVVLMDWCMPEVDGLSAAHAIATNRQLNNQPTVIMVTAHEREVLASQNTFDTPYSELLTKPVTPYQLAKSIWRSVTGKPLVFAPEELISEPVTPLAGLRLLVVEDNALNRQIAQELLQGAGAEVELAEGGLEGVDKVFTSDPAYDLVIMDIQMPDIDGYEATRRIRAHSGFVSIPILAMTANASAADKEACLAVGMNGHVGKPIDMDLLISNILQLLNREATSTDKPATNTDNQSPIDDATIILKRFGNNRDLFSRMLTNFRPEIMRLLDALASNTNDNHLSNVTATLHSLKGVAATMGAKLLSRTAATLESQCKQADENEFTHIVNSATSEQLLQLFELSEPLLMMIAQDQHPTQASKAPETFITDDQIHQQLQEILPLLEADNMGAIDMIETLCQQTPQHTPLKQISALINALDFSQAIKLIHQLLQEKNT